MSEERLTDIEIKLAFQEDTVKELNDVICRQQDQIDRLNMAYEQLLSRVKELSDRVPDAAAADEKPPHY